jgi:Ferritin-like domain
MTSANHDHARRAAFMASALAAGTGRRVAGTLRLADAAGARAATDLCTDTVQSILNTALVAERIAATLYYAALTTPAVMRDSRLAGRSANPNDPGLPPGGNPQHVRFLQAALDAELKHAALLSAAGAQSPYTRFYFPPTTFQRLGTSVDPGSFLGVAELLETAMSGMYVAAAEHFLQLGRHDLAARATQLLGVEAEHRTLARVIAGVHPPNDLTLAPAPFACVGDVDTELRPFLTGRRFLFAHDSTTAIALPSAARARRVIGKYGTRQLSRFL